MQILLILSISSFVLTLILTPWCRNLFLRWGMVDHPDGDRKIHTAPIPNMGGIPIAAAYLASFGILVFFGRTDSVSQSLLPLLWARRDRPAWPSSWHGGRRSRQQRVVHRCTRH